MNPDQQKLILAYLEGKISKEDGHVLEKLLKESKEAREYLRTVATIELGLQDYALDKIEHLSEPQISTASLVTFEPLESQKRSSIMNLVSVLVALSALVLLSLFIFLQSGSNISGKSKTEFVASLTSVVNCKWKSESVSYEIGDRLPVGRLVIESGQVEIWFDSGSKLLLQGESELQIDSKSSATLTRGKVTFISTNDESFDLKTPYSILVDLGTEYAVSISESGEEVHVYDGEVWRTSINDQDQVDFILGGKAKRFEEGLQAGSSSIELSKEFVRLNQSSHAEIQSTKPELIASESFDYSDNSIMTSSTANGGFGWNGAWRGIVRSRDHLETEDNCFSKELNLSIGSLPSTGGVIQMSGNVAFNRTLKQPIRLDQDQVYFFRVLFSWESERESSSATLFVNFRSSDEEQKSSSRFVNAFKPNNCMFVRLEGTSKARLSGKPIQQGMFVGKVVARKNQPDQVFLTILSQEDKFEMEPTEWNLESKFVDINESYDLFAIHGISQDLIVDEVRIGTTWRSIIDQHDLK